jgi:hypothetical protein
MRPRRYLIVAVGAGHPINFRDAVAAALPEQARDKPLEVWFQML